MAETASLKKVRVLFAVLAIVFGLFMITAKLVYYNAVELPQFTQQEEELENRKPLESTGEPFADALTAFAVGAGRGGEKAGLDIAKGLTSLVIMTGIIWFSVYILLAAICLKRQPKRLPIGRLILTIISALFVWMMFSGVLEYIGYFLCAATLVMLIVYIAKYAPVRKAIKAEQKRQKAEVG